jgi:hypothetical protein
MKTKNSVAPPKAGAKPKRKTEAQLQAQCDEWNRTHPMGCDVWYHPVIGEPGCSKYPTREMAAYVLGGHTAVVFLEGKSGCVALDALTDEETKRS